MHFSLLADLAMFIMLFPVPPRELIKATLHINNLITNVYNSIICFIQESSVGEQDFLKHLVPIGWEDESGCLYGTILILNLNLLIFYITRSLVYYIM
jgi:hypothetical protein